MVALLPNQCSIKLHQNNNSNPSSMPSFVLSIGTGRHPSRISAISMLKTSNRTKNLVPFIINNNQPKLLFAETLMPTTGFSAGKQKTEQKDNETLETEVESIICRLKIVVEKVRELEIQKLMGRLKETTISDEDRLLVENSSREILDKFLQRPVQYLRSANGDYQQKLKDVNLLIRMLEKSCIECQR